MIFTQTFKPSQYSFALSLVLMLPVNQGLHKYDLEHNIWNGYISGNSILSCRSCPSRPWLHHTCHSQIKAIITPYQSCFPCFGDFSILDWSMLKIFRRPKFQSIYLQTRFSGTLGSSTNSFIFIFGLSFSRMRQPFKV